MPKYSDILTSFKSQDTLSPMIWNNVDTKTPVLKPHIRKALLAIAEEFVNFLDAEFFIDNITFTGSLANYNWSEFSDIDLHVLVDFSQFDENYREMYKELFSLKKTLFNSTHNITVKGYEVELYAQDITESHFSTGVYSVMFDNWVAPPEKEKFQVDKGLLLTKVEYWMNKIDEVLDETKQEELDDALQIIDDFKDKLKRYRSAGLEKGGEYSYENLTFKFLRRNGYIQKLFDFKNQLIDKRLSLENEEVE